MRDRRDVILAVLAGALLFCLGLLAGQSGGILPGAEAQDSGNLQDPNAPGAQPPVDPGPPDIRPEGMGRIYAATPMDSNSNNRFVAITSPVGSGESVLFVLDSKHEQLLCYRFLRNKGLSFLAARKIDYDLKINEWNDQSRFTRDEMKRLYAQHAARAAAKAVKGDKGGSE